MTTSQHTPGTPERVSALLDEADYWLDADTGWKGKLSGAERLARRNSDLAAAQVNATLAVADQMRGIRRELAGLPEALGEIRTDLNEALAEIRDALGDGDGEDLVRLDRTLDAGLSAVTESLDAIRTTVGNRS